MNLSLIQNFLSGDVSQEIFCSNLKSDSSDFKLNHNSQGNSLPVYLNDDIQELILHKNDLMKICHLYLEDFITDQELEYACNLLDMSERIVMEEDLSEAVFQLSTPEINETLSKKMVFKLLSQFT